MSTIDALNESFSVVKRNPILLVAGLVTSTVLGVLGLIPLIGPIVSIFVAPFLIGGLLGMASKALDGSTDLGEFLAAGKEHYLKILGATLILGVAYLGGMIAIAVPTAFIGTFSMGMGSGSTAGFGGFGTAVLVMLALLFLAVLVVGFLLQFYTVAIVVGGANATGSFAQSYRVVRENLAGTLAYVALRIALGVAIAVPAVLGVVVGSALGDSSGSLAVMAFFGVFTLIFALVGTAVIPTFQAAFYRAHLAQTPAAE